MGKQKKKSLHRRSDKQPIGYLAHGTAATLHSYEVGAVPILQHFLKRMNLEAILKQHLPPDDPRTKIPIAKAVTVLVCNMLVSREPIYGVGEWAARHAPDLWGLSARQVTALNDDCLGRVLGRVFTVTGPALVIAIVRYVIQEFELRLDELHNDSTTVTFSGAYAGAAEEGKRDGRPTHAITWGHNKDHRPDLKQLLYTLTVAEDGGVPIYFTSDSGNVTDDQTHCHTWEILRQLVGRSDFLYVADCKLASRENLDYLARRGGRFITILPRTRKEDAEFRRRQEQDPASVAWQPVYQVKVKFRVKGQEQERVVDELSVCSPEMSSAEGYRLLWYHSTRKVELDAATRARRTQRALAELAELERRLAGPRTRFRQRGEVEKAVHEILEEFAVERWVVIRIEAQEEARYRQASRGRPSKETRYVKVVKPRYRLSWHVDTLALMAEQVTDGMFPLITNASTLNAEEILRAYKRQPIIEKRFSQFKTDFQVAPVYLKDVARIQGLLCVYFLTLLVQTLIERELRRAMEREGLTSLPLYPEERACRRPTTSRVIEVFGPLQRHVLTLPNGREEVLATHLTPLQREILRLLGIPTAVYTE